MKKYMIIVVAALLTVSVFGQEEGTVDDKITKKLTREQRLEQRRAKEEATAKMVDWLIENRQFVLKARFLSNQTGERIPVNDDLNFIVIDSTEITIQIASTMGIGGPNGLGGITTRGSISQFEIQRIGRNKESYNIRILAMTSIGSYDIFLSISPTSNTDASISGTGRGRLNYHGVIVPVKGSRIYKGMSI